MVWWCSDQQRPRYARRQIEEIRMITKVVESEFWRVMVSLVQLTSNSWSKRERWWEVRSTEGISGEKSGILGDFGIIQWWLSENETYLNCKWIVWSLRYIVFDMKSSPIITCNFNKFPSYLRNNVPVYFYSICNPLRPLHVSRIGRIDDYW